MSIRAEISEFETARNIVDALFGDAIPAPVPIAKNVRQSNPKSSVMSVVDGCSARPEVESANRLHLTRIMRINRQMAALRSFKQK